MTEQEKLFDDLPEYSGQVSKHPLYRVWAAMIARCYNPNCRSFRRYGGRGIVVSDEWRKSSRAFLSWAIANGYRPGLQIDRKDNNCGYSSKNCRFVTARENTNNRFNTRRLSNGKPVSDALRASAFSVHTVKKRLRLGWSPDDAVSVPPGGKRPSPVRKGGDA